MISDSPPDRELEWTDEGIQSSKNLINRIGKYFQKQKTENINNTIKKVEKFIFEMEKNILNFSLNKCVANIYTIFNFLEKEKVYLGNSDLSKKILTCIYPILPNLSSTIYKDLFKEDINTQEWPTINEDLLYEDKIDLPIQINGKLVHIFSTKKDYQEDKLLNEIKNIDKIKLKINNMKIKKVINVQNKIINIIVA